MQTGFVQRNSKITASHFLRMLLFDHFQYCIPSLDQHALSFNTDENKQVSKQALDKRFNETALSFVEKLLEVFLSRQIDFNGFPSHLSQTFTAVKVMDSTEFKLPDFFANDFPGYGIVGSPACAAIQLEYDVLARTIHYLSLGNARQSDKTIADQRIGLIQKGDLILRDLGYYSTDSYQKIEQQQAFYISRLKAQVGIYQKVDNRYESLNWTSIIQQIRKGSTGYFDQYVYIGKQQKHPVRLMAWILSEKEQKKRLQRKKSQKKNISKEDIIWSKLNVIITNIDANTMKAQEAYNLYKIRWQIEWMFKIWKSILNIDTVRKMKTVRLKCYLYSKLIWVLLCWEITGVAELHTWHEYHTLISPYKCLAILKTKAFELKRILFFRPRCLRSWLNSTIEILIKYGKKESKNTRPKLCNLLQLVNAQKG